MNQEQHYQLTDGVLVQWDLPEVVLLDSRNGRYYEMNRSGSALLRALHQGHSMARAMVEIQASLDVSAPSLEGDCTALLRELLDLDLVQVRQ